MSVSVSIALSLSIPASIYDNIGIGVVSLCQTQQRQPL